MRKSSIGLFAGAIVLALTCAMARADCIDDRREVVLDKDNVIRLRSYLCRTGNGTAPYDIKVEFHRLSDAAASLVAANRSSTLLQKTIGTPKVVENEVLDVYRGLLNQFGQSFHVGESSSGNLLAQFGVETAGQGGSASGLSDSLSEPMVRVLVGDNTLPTAYPAIDEAAALQKRTIPNDLSFFYSGACSNPRKICESIVV